MVMEYISQAWDAYKRNFWQIIGGLLLVMLITFGIIIIGALPLLASFIQYYGGVSSPTTAAFANFISDSAAQIAIFIAGILAAFMAAVALNAGYVKMLADSLKGKAEISTIFETAKEKFWTILGANILTLLIVSALALVLLVPPFLIMASSSIETSDVSGIFAVLGALLWFFAGLIIFILAVLPFTLVEQAVVIGNHGVVDSVKKSFSVVKGNYLQFLALVVILGVVSGVVSLVPLMGDLINLFVVTPIMLLSYTIFYLAKTGKTGARKPKRKR
ncbi:MAG: hypothetical protein WA139_03105 [Candidatus Aenigmatarchaeota archaeon]